MTAELTTRAKAAQDRDSEQQTDDWHFRHLSFPAMPQQTEPRRVSTVRTKVDQGSPLIVPATLSEPTPTNPPNDKDAHPAKNASVLPATSTTVRENSTTKKKRSRNKHTYVKVAAGMGDNKKSKVKKNKKKDQKKQSKQTKATSRSPVRTRSQSNKECVLSLSPNTQETKQPATPMEAIDLTDEQDDTQQSTDESDSSVFRFFFCELQLFWIIFSHTHYP